MLKTHINGFKVIKRFMENTPKQLLLGELKKLRFDREEEEFYDELDSNHSDSYEDEFKDHYFDNLCLLL